MRDLSQMQLLCLITFKKIRIWLTDVHLRFYLLRVIMVADFELDPEFVENEERMMDCVKRHTEAIVKDSDRTFKCVLVTGVRQTTNETKK